MSAYMAARELERIILVTPEINLLSAEIRRTEPRDLDVCNSMSPQGYRWMWGQLPRDCWTILSAWDEDDGCTHDFISIISPDGTMVTCCEVQ